MVIMRRRRWEGAQPGRRIWPYEQNLARCVIDDESRGVTNTTRAEPAAITVAGQYEQVGVGTGGHHLTLRSPSAYRA